MRLTKICAVMALTICELTSTIGGNAFVVGAAEANNVATQKVQVRRPTFHGKLAGDKDDKTYYLDEGKVKGISWDESRKQLTLDSFNGDGGITLDYDVSNENFPGAHDESVNHIKNDSVSVVVKGNNRINHLSADCTLNISGDGVISVNDSKFANVDSYGDESVYSGSNINIEGVTLNDASLYGENITIKNAKVNRNFTLWNAIEAESASPKEYDPVYKYSSFVRSFGKVTVDNSEINLSYAKPTDKQLKNEFRLAAAFDANNYFVKNSKINFKGSKKALRNVVPFYVGLESDESIIEKGNFNIKAGMVLMDHDYSYRVKKVGDKVSEVELIEARQVTFKKITIKNYANVQGGKYKITSIGKNAFVDFKLKKVIIKNKYLKKIGKKAIVNCNGKTVVVKVPKSKKKAYKKLLKKAGIKKVVVK